MNFIEKWFVYLFLVTFLLNPLSANPTKWSNTLKQFVGKLPKVALKGLIPITEYIISNHGCIGELKTQVIWQLC